MPRTYYEVLGVDEDASPEAIRTAYRDRVKETHPDVSDDPDADERFRRVQTAREVLTDPETRERYDRLGHERFVGANDSVADSPSTEDGHRERTGPAEAGGTEGTGTATDATADAGPTGPTAGETGTGSKTREPSGGREGTDAAGWYQSGPGMGSRRGTARAGESAYAVHNDYRRQRFDRVRVPLTAGSLIQIVSMFFLYPVFLFASIFPPFPLVVNVVVGVCTLAMVGYLLSIPDVAVVVFGAWSVLTPLVLVGSPDLQLFTVFGVVALAATWAPLSLAVLVQSALRG